MIRRTRANTSKANKHVKSEHTASKVHLRTRDPTRAAPGLQCRPRERFLRFQEAQRATYPCVISRRPAWRSPCLQEGAGVRNKNGSKTLSWSHFWHTIHTSGGFERPAAGFVSKLRDFAGCARREAHRLVLVRPKPYALHTKAQNLQPQTISDS